MQGLFTFLKVAALFVISIGGVVYLFQGKTENFADSFNGTTNDVTSIALAIYSCMWAYSGYNNLNEIAEEIVNPKKNIPKAIIASLTLVTIIYISTNVSYFTLLSKEEFLSVNAVAFTWSERVLGAAAIFIPLSVMCSVHGASNGGFFTAVRLRFAAARAGHLPEMLSFLHYKTRIPLVSLIFNTFVAIVMLIPVDIAELINIVSFIGFISQGLTVVAFLKMRYDIRNKPVNPDHFRIPIVVAVVALMVCIFMTVSPFISNPKIEFLYGVGFVLSGLLLYLPFVYLGWKLPGWDAFTTISQLSMELCPTVLDDDLDL